MKTLLAKQQLKPGSDSDNNSQEDKGEPLSKEKLKYLRYFRLVTHRKRNGMYHRSWSVVIYPHLSNMINFIDKIKTI